MMIGFIAQDCERPVELLNKNQAYQLMRKRHLAERDLLVGAVIDFGGESVRAAHDKHEALAAARHATLQPLAEIQRSALCAVLIEQDNVVAVL